MTKKLDKKTARRIFILIIMTFCMGMVCESIFNLCGESKEHKAAMRIQLIDSIQTSDDSIWNLNLMDQCREAQDVGIEIGIDSGRNIERHNLGLSPIKTE
jgi:hypothetical protein